MIPISITAAFEAIAADGCIKARRAPGALHGPGESYSDVILKLVELKARA